MGRLVAWAKEIPWKHVHKEYERLLLEALSLETTAKKHSGVLEHVMGYFRVMNRHLIVLAQPRSSPVPKAARLLGSGACHGWQIYGFSQ